MIKRYNAVYVSKPTRMRNSRKGITLFHPVLVTELQNMYTSSAWKSGSRRKSKNSSQTQARWFPGKNSNVRSAKTASPRKWRSRTT